MKKQWDYKITAVLIIVTLFLILGISLAVICFHDPSGGTCVAEIYQDGELLTSISLDGAGAPWRFTVTGDNGCVNEIEVRAGSIGIISADCPDKLCVHQGFISNTGLPIVCLPNKLVIRLRDADSEDIDVTAY